MALVNIVWTRHLELPLATFRLISLVVASLLLFLPYRYFFVESSHVLAAVAILKPTIPQDRVLGSYWPSVLIQGHFLPVGIPVAFALLLSLQRLQNNWKYVDRTLGDAAAN